MSLCRFCPFHSFHPFCPFHPFHPDHVNEASDAEGLVDSDCITIVSQIFQYADHVAGTTSNCNPDPDL